MKLELYTKDRKFDVNVNSLGDDLEIEFDGRKFRVGVRAPASDGSIPVELDGRELRVVLEDETERLLKISIDGDRESRVHQSLLKGAYVITLHRWRLELEHSFVRRVGRWAQRRCTQEQILCDHNSTHG